MFRERGKRSCVADIRRLCANVKKLLVTYISVYLTEALWPQVEQNCLGRKTFLTVEYRKRPDD